MTPLVSVIIPTHNRETLVKEAVESVLAQDYPAIELIVVDDGSTDHTETVLAAFPSIMYRSQEHRGVSVARNQGIAIARGKYISFLDSDDLWLPRKLSTQVEVMETDPRIAVSYTDEIWIRRGRRVNPKRKHQKYSGWIFPQCLPLCIISPSSVMLTPAVFEEVGAFDEDLPVCEDYDLWLRVASRFPVRFIEEKLITKRGGHKDQLSCRYWGNDRFRVQALRKIIADSQLDETGRSLAIEELIRKAAILEQGFRKREKFKEADYYQTLRQHYRL